MIILDVKQKVTIAIMPEEDLIDSHFDLGIEIRNTFGLHVPENGLLGSSGVTHPDDAFGIIIQALWKRLRAPPEA